MNNKNEFELKPWKTNLLKNKKLKWLLFLDYSWIIFALPYILISLISNQNWLDFWYYSVFIFTWFIFYFSLFGGILKIKLSKTKKWKKDLYLSIGFCIFWPVALINSIIAFLIFKDTNWIFYLLIPCTMSLVNIFLLWRLYISNKPLFMAILKWKNIYPLIRESLNQDTTSKINQKNDK